MRAGGAFLEKRARGEERKRSGVGVQEIWCSTLEQAGSAVSASASRQAERERTRGLQAVPKQRIGTAGQKYDSSSTSACRLC